MNKSILAILVVSTLSFAKIAPTFQGDLLSGGRAKLQDYLKENRSLLICFWASWCTPCMEELKMVKEKMQAETGLPLDVLTVNVDTSDTASDVKPTLKMYKFDFPVVLDPKHEIFSKYHETKTLPFSVLLSAKGEMLSVFNGYSENMFTEIKTAVNTKTN